MAPSRSAQQGRTLSSYFHSVWGCKAIGLSHKHVSLLAFRDMVCTHSYVAEKRLLLRSVAWLVGFRFESCGFTSRFLGSAHVAPPSVLDVQFSSKSRLYVVYNCRKSATGWVMFDVRPSDIVHTWCQVDIIPCARFASGRVVLYRVCVFTCTCVAWFVFICFFFPSDLP